MFKGGPYGVNTGFWFVPGWRFPDHITTLIKLWDIYLQMISRVTLSFVEIWKFQWTITCQQKNARPHKCRFMALLVRNTRGEWNISWPWVNNDSHSSSTPSHSKFEENLGAFMPTYKVDIFGASKILGASRRFSPNEHFMAGGKTRIFSQMTVSIPQKALEHKLFHIFWKTPHSKRLLFSEQIINHFMLCYN